MTCSSGALSHQRHNTSRNVTTGTDLGVANDQINTDSLQIAEHFGKAHNLVLRTIRNLECSREFNQCNFAPVEYLDAKGEKRPCYRITRDGHATCESSRSLVEKLGGLFRLTEQEPLL